MANEKKSKPDEVKIAILLNILGADGLKIFNTFKYAEGEDQTKFETMINKFEQYCMPVRNLIYN